jgi:hypothetical protein
MANRNLVKHHGTLGAGGKQGGTLYASVPMALARDGKLSQAARSVAMLIWSHDQKWNQSANLIAQELGMSRNTVAAALADLEKHRWLVREVYIEPGKTRPKWEQWHIQLSNTPFSPAEVQKLSTSSCSKPEHGDAQKLSKGLLRNRAGGCSKTEQHSSAVSSALEVHSSSASKGTEQPDGLPVTSNPVNGCGHSGRSQYDPFGAESGIRSQGQSAFVARTEAVQSTSGALSLLADAIRASESGRLAAVLAAPTMQVSSDEAKRIVLPAIDSGDLLLISDEYGKYLQLPV